MREVAVLLDRDFRPLHWHDPVDSSSVSLPDSVTLWDKIWEKRDVLWAIAHTHPGMGRPQASHTDLTTFVAIEGSLGRNLVWFIATCDHLSQFTRKQSDPVCYVQNPAMAPRWWLAELRGRSYDEAPKGYIWVCLACGRTARHSIEGGASEGWDESCYTHKVLVDEGSIEYKNNRVAFGITSNGEIKLQREEAHG